VGVRFHLVDRVLEWEPEKSVRAQKLVSYSEELLEEVDGELVMPPPLVLEALCQAGTWLVMISTERRKRAALLSIASVDFVEAPKPGDVLDIEGVVESMSDEVAVVSGTVTVDGRTVLDAKDIMCTLIDAGDLADLDDTHRLQKMLTRSEG
jgi:3-hydroxyacyl-[acyl-carrier-protein] dehydratase